MIRRLLLVICVMTIPLRGFAQSGSINGAVRDMSGHPSGQLAWVAQHVFPYLTEDPTVESVGYLSSAYSFPRVSFGTYHVKADSFCFLGPYGSPGMNDLFCPASNPIRFHNHGAAVVHNQEHTRAPHLVLDHRSRVYVGGNVIDGEKGVPKLDVALEILSPLTNTYSRVHIVRTDDNGHFNFSGLIPGSYRLSLNSALFSPMYELVSGSQFLQLQVAPQIGLENVLIKVRKVGINTIRGKINLPIQLDKPFNVEAHGPSGVIVLGTVDLSGNFELRVPVNGSYQLYANHFYRRNVPPFPGPILLSPNQITVDTSVPNQFHEFFPTWNGRMFAKGEIVSDTGETMSDVELAVYCQIATSLEQRQFVGAPKTFEDGSFALFTSAPIDASHSCHVSFGKQGFHFFPAVIEFVQSGNDILQVANITASRFAGIVTGTVSSEDERCGPLRLLVRDSFGNTTEIKLDSKKFSAPLAYGSYQLIVQRRAREVLKQDLKVDRPAVGPIDLKISSSCWG